MEEKKDAEYKYKKYKSKYTGLKTDNYIKLPVRDPWLYYIQIGNKTVEGRRGTHEKFASWINKKILLVNKERMIPVIVTDIKHYPDLYSYIDGEGVEKIAPQLSTKEQVIEEYHKFWSDDEIAKAGGMVAIYFKLA